MPKRKDSLYLSAPHRRRSLAIGLTLAILVAGIFPNWLTPSLSPNAGPLSPANDPFVAGESIGDAAGEGEAKTQLRDHADHSHSAVYELLPALSPGGPLAPAAPLEAWNGDGIFYAGWHWDAASLWIIDEALALLPPRIRWSLGNRALGPLNITVSLSGSTPTGYQPYGGPANFFSTNEGRNDLVLYANQGLLTVLHELGHAYNLRNQPAATYAPVLLEPEMQGFMAAAGWQVLSPPAAIWAMRDQSEAAYASYGPMPWTRISRNDPLEDFANSFALYFANPHELHQLSPERYFWFESAVGRW